MPNSRSRRKRRPGRYILLGAILFGSLWLIKGCLFGSGGDPRKQADIFFRQAAHDPVAAFNSMAEEYQLLTDEDTFQDSLKPLELADLKALVWTDSLVNGSKARLKGRLERDGRAPGLIEVTMLKKDQRWRVLRFNYIPPPPSAAAHPGSPAPSAETSQVRPEGRNNEEMIGLVKRHFQALSKALETDDFSGFHQLAAGLWRAQISPAEMRSAYAPLKPHARLILELAQEGRFEIISINTAPQAGGIPVIKVTGQALKGDRRLRFSLQLVSERNRWLMVGLEAALY